jgi:hypothetical protein
MYCLAHYLHNEQSGRSIAAVHSSVLEVFTYVLHDFWVHELHVLDVCLTCLPTIHAVRYLANFETAIVL